MGLPAQVELRFSLARHCRLSSWVKLLTRSKAVNEQLTYLLFYIDIHRRNDRYNKMRPSSLVVVVVGKGGGGGGGV